MNTILVMVSKTRTASSATVPYTSLKTAAATLILWVMSKTAQGVKKIITKIAMILSWKDLGRLLRDLAMTYK